MLPSEVLPPGVLLVVGVSTPEAYAVRLMNLGVAYGISAGTAPGVKQSQVILRGDITSMDGWEVQERRTPIPFHDPRNAVNSFWDTEWQGLWDDERYGDTGMIHNESTE
jgi:hypothetical protein